LDYGVSEVHEAVMGVKLDCCTSSTLLDGRA
jgi:hypothetical protein